MVVFSANQPEPSRRAGSVLLELPLPLPPILNRAVRFPLPQGARNTLATRCDRHATSREILFAKSPDGEPEQARSHTPKPFDAPGTPAEPLTGYIIGMDRASGKFSLGGRIRVFPACRADRPSSTDPEPRGPSHAPLPTRPSPQVIRVPGNSAAAHAAQRHERTPACRRPHSEFRAHEGHEGHEGIGGRTA